MWFVGNHPDATRHHVLPWYHTSFELLEEPRAAPRGKYRRSRDLHISDIADWQDLRDRVYTPETSERLIVEPLDPTLIRNRTFVTELAEFAKANNITIVLHGGVLSHAFYMLNRRGVRVECVDLFGQYEEIAEFDKLVRDNVPDVIISRGERAAVVKLRGDALIVALKRKLVEEAFEALDTNSGAALVEELADIVEVVRAVAQALGIGLADIEETRKDKLRKRGALKDGIMLVSTRSPGSLARRRAREPESFLVANGGVRVISEPSQLPTRPIRRRPDLRFTDAGDREKLLAIDVELASLSEATEDLDFSFFEEGATAPSLRMTLELRRERGTIRVVGRVRKGAFQLDFLHDLGLP